MQKRPFELEISLPVKTYDIDFAGVVSNIVYIRWLEDLRLEMLMPYFPVSEQLKDGIAPVLLHTKIDYKHPVRFGDAVSGNIWIELMDSLRWTVNATIAVNDKVAAVAEQVGIFINLQTHKPIRTPQKLKQHYQNFIAVN